MRISDLDIKFGELRERLENVESARGALLEIQSIIKLYKNQDAVDVIRQFGLETLFDCFHSVEPRDVELACNILRMCFEKLPPGEIIQNYKELAKESLKSSNEIVLQLVVSEIDKISKSVPLEQHLDLILAVIPVVVHRNLEISKHAKLIVARANVVANPEVLVELKGLLGGDASAKCNVFEVIEKMSVGSSNAFTACVDAGFVDILLADLPTTDCVYKENILEFFCNMVRSSHVREYFIENGVIAHIARCCSEIGNSAWDSLYVPAFLQFTCIVGERNPELMITKYPAFIQLVFDGLRSDDLELTRLPIHALGYVGSSMEGKMLLYRAMETARIPFTIIGRTIRTGKSSQKLVGFSALAKLVSVNGKALAENDADDVRVSRIAQFWFNSISERPPAIEVLFQYCRNPFHDDRMCAYTVLTAVVEHKWGREMVASTAGFREFLLDRSAEYYPSCKFLKHAIVSRLSNSSEFDAETRDMFRKFADEGPMYMAMEHEVAVEMKE